jgi:hypothetical protein
VGNAILTDLLLADRVLFDPNSGDAPTGLGYIPAMPDGEFTQPVISARQYAETFMTAVDGPGSEGFFRANLVKALSAINAAPSLQPYSKISLMPASYANNIIEWPGARPEMLMKIANEHLAPKVIIQQRSADVLRYAGVATHPWKPGWKIELRGGYKAPTDEDTKAIAEMESFIANCAIDVTDVRERDAKRFRSFRNFLTAIVRDRFRYDFVTVWTDMDAQGRVRAFKAMPADRIRLTTVDGYQGDPNVFAVGLDDGGRVQREFTRNELFTCVYNERTDVDAMGYGYSEIEMALRIIQAFTDAFDMNADVFNKSAVPSGILMAKGWNNKQLEVLSAIWTNLKKGTSKSWALPAMGIPKDGDLEILDLSRLKDNDVYYENFINMLAGLYSTIYCFPVDRLGYKISGSGPDRTPEKDTTSGTIVDIADPGLAPLLDYIESMLNEYIIWTRYPNLQFRFQGKNPKEDARAYEAKMEAATYGEHRSLSDLPPLESLSTDKDHKELLQLLALAPVNPNVAPTWQQLVGAYMASKAQDKAADQQIDLQAHAAGVPPKPPGARMNGKTDPAKSEAHGATSGVRRDSKAEAAAKAFSSLYISRPVENAEEILNWAAAEGIPNLLLADDLHVTVAYSRQSVEWDMVGSGMKQLKVPNTSDRIVSYLGDEGAIVLKFTSPSLQSRWADILDAGASYDYPEYQPHITLSYRAPGLLADVIRPFKGPIVLGAERFAPINDTWKEQLAVGKTIEWNSVGNGIGVNDVIPEDEDEEDDTTGPGAGTRIINEGQNSKY